MRAALRLIPALLAACAASGSPYGVTTNHLKAGTGAATAGATTGGATSGSQSASGGSTSSTAGSSTGSTTGATVLSCANAALTDCGAGSVELLGQVVDLLTGSPVSGPVQVLDLDDATLSATSGPSGVVHVCVAPDTTIAPEVQVSGYVDTVYNDIDLVSSECIPQLLLFPTQLWDDVVAELPGYDATQSAIIVGISNLVGHPVCQVSGWSFSLRSPDGGSVSAAIAYVVGTQVSPTATETTASGMAIFYNVDSSFESVSVVGLQSLAPDGGDVPCGQYPGAREYTGQLHLAGNGLVSNYGFTITDAG